MNAKGIGCGAVPSDTMTHRIAAGLVFLLVVTGCGDDAAPATTTTAPPATTTTDAPTTTTPVTTTTTPLIPSSGEPLPPADLESLAAIFDPLVAPYGYRIGRAALIDRGTYRETPDGNHLALYLTPLVAKTADDYVADFMPLARLFMPGVFEAWSGLLSFDVCQEPFEWEGSTSPPGLTILDVNRVAADEIDRATVDLAGLLDADQELEGLDIHAQQDIRTTDAWSAAAGG